MNFAEYIEYDFEIRDGVFYSYSAWGNYRVQKFGWGGDEYKVIGMGADYDPGYSVEKDTYGDWYLKKGYEKICRLTHLGGENWRKY
ncbi:MAG: hypothetical protein IJ400_05425 [Clostridia bacterium]|nr:hypothetical protein [Clostridia bacterium]